MNKQYEGTVNEYGKVLQYINEDGEEDSLIIRYIFHQYKNKKIRIIFEER